MSFDDAIIKEMTLEEKVGQLTMPTADYATTGPVAAQNVTEGIRRGKVGSIFNLWGRDATRAAQRIAVEESRLKIPLFFGLDVIHGFRTVFPVPLAEACAFDPILWERTAQIAAAESARAGLHLTFAPMLDIGRDPRWGRIVEGPGEDPLVGERFARAKIRGLQGGDVSAEDRLAATAKHYAGYGAATAGRDYAPVDISERSLQEVYLPPFRAAVEEGALAVMPAFTDLEAIPLTANVRMLRTVLRERWGFDGAVISDYGAIGELIKHGVAADLTEAAALALKAGVDIDMMSFAYEHGLPSALARGLVDAAEIDAAVLRVLRLKDRLGLFDDPYRRCREGEEPAVEEARSAARQAARRSLVLLKNADGLLPLDSRHRRIAVIGPLADSPADMLGSWSATGRGEEAVSVLEGLRRSRPDAEIVHAQGVSVDGDEGGGIDAAAALARTADCVLLCVGEAAWMSGEAASRARLDLPGQQADLVDAVTAAGKPVAALLFSGRPLCAPALFAKADAVIACWFPGSEAGHAIADILTGETAPSGRLSMTWPRHPGQVPVYFAARSSGRPENPSDKYTSKYLDLPTSPEFHFGHGLGYGGFTFEDLSVDVSAEPALKFAARKEAPRAAGGTFAFGDLAVDAGPEVTVRFVVGNRSAQPAWTTAFLFIRDPVASVARPVLELKRFETVRLEGNERRAVGFVLTRRDLSFPDENFQPKFESGAFEILVGPSADRSVLLSKTIQVS